MRVCGVPLGALNDSGGLEHDPLMFTARETGQGEKAGARIRVHNGEADCDRPMNTPLF
jgi:hypothetical protein